MQPRPKYKTGDILEYWDMDRNFVYYSIVVGVIGSTCGSIKCTSCRAGKNTYLLKPMQGGEIEDYSIKEIDMIYGNQSTSCRSGWRKVG